MKTERISDTRLKISATFGELVNMESCGLQFYATPDSQEKVASVYAASQPQFAYDQVVATPAQFAEAQGWTDLGWQDMTEEELDAAREDEYSIRIENEMPIATY